jgi:hypothetical protein
VDLPTPILVLGGEARDTLQKHREMLRRAVPAADGLTALDPVAHFHQLPEFVEVCRCRDAQNIEPSNRGAPRYPMLLHASPKGVTLPSSCKM